MAKVTVYSAEWCPWCTRVKDFLAKNKVAFVEKKVDKDQDAAAEVLQKSGQTGIPVIIIGDEVIVGFDEPRLRQLLKIN
ncbi:MAG: glutaredoxin family protein [Candidatus Micrarchaeota archaeon]|nr:glutaredoxin family protein [Candidatus Micrarchaeota archaeon]